MSMRIEAHPGAAERPEAAANDVRLSLLGGIELTADGVDVPLPVSAQRLLAFVALHEHRQHRHYIGGKLWSESTEGRAAGCLRSSVWRLRRTGLHVLESSGPYLRVAPSLDVDFRTALAWARRLLDPSDTSCPTVAEAQLSEELIPDWYDDWVVLERERFAQLRMHALERLSERLAARGRFAEAAEAALEAVRGEPLRESSHRALMRVHVAEGNVAEALEQFHYYRRLLNRELGLAPSREMHDLVRDVLCAR